MEHSQQILTYGHFELPQIEIATVPERMIENLPFKKYLNMKQYVSSSGLRQLINHSPYYFKSDWENSLQTKDDEDTDTEFFKFGRAVHTYFLEPKKFKENWVLLPKFSQKKVDKELKKKFLSSLPDDAVIVTQKEMEIILAMTKSVQQHREALHIMKSGAPEVTILFQDDVTGILCKARPDLFVFDETKGRLDVFDLKTTHNSRFFANDAGKFKYHMQIQFYARALEKYYNKDVTSVSLISLSKKDYCECAVHQLNHFELQKAEDQNRAALDILKQCLETKYWPMRQESAEMLNMPRKFLEEEIPQYDFSQSKEMNHG